MVIFIYDPSTLKSEQTPLIPSFLSECASQTICNNHVIWRHISQQFCVLALAIKTRDQDHCLDLDITIMEYAWKLKVHEA